MLQRLHIALPLWLLLGPLACGETPPAAGGSGASGGAAGNAGVSGASTGGATSGGSASGTAGSGGASGGAGMPGCALGQSQCAGLCTDLATNVANCGACGVVCAAGQSCSTGVCQCMPGLSACGAACVNTSSDGQNCGTCGNACSAGQVCSLGGCGTTCATGLTQCDASCVDLVTDGAHCGACGATCSGGQSCVAGACACPSGQVQCGGVCVDTQSDAANCGACAMACGAGAVCSGGTCLGGTGGSSGESGGAGSSGASGSAGSSGGNGGTSGAGNGGTSGAAGSSGSSGASGSSGSSGSAGTGGTGLCDPGSTTTQWATSCPTSTPACTPGTWTKWGSSSPENYPFRYETEHFAFYWPDERGVTVAQAEAAGDYLEDVVWKTYMGDPIYWPEPDCNSSNKRKVSIHIIESGLYGGCNNGRPGIWVGPGALADHWGLGHEFMHSLQCMTNGFADCGAGGCWIHESHANFMPHQLPEYRGDVHCSEMLVNAPHLYYGSTRDRYCNWQFFEFLKDKHCYKAVNDMWAAAGTAGLRDPWNKLAQNMGWNAEQLNDLFGEWAMHNITWDYQNPPPTNRSNQGATYRQRYGAITDESRPERRLRLTSLEPLDGQWATNRRFQSPHFWAPQRWGYNVVRLYPDAGATSVRVKFRGVTQGAANSGWRWGLVATDSGITTSRYSALKGGSDGELEFCITSGESLWLVVMGAPTAITKIVWDQAYPSIYRYPYMVELAGAWPEGFRNGQLDACPSGTQRHSNGNGCAVSGLPASVFVGPYAQVLGGTVSGNARIDDHAVILAGASVTGGTVSALSILNRFSVSGSATVETTFYPPGFFESGQGLSGTARLFGDVEYRGQGLNKSSGSFYGFVDTNTPSASINDVTVAPPYTWRN